MAVMSRLSRLIRGFFGLFISGLEESNPEALMEAARQDFRDKMAQYNLALAQMAGVAERLKNQIKGKTTRAQELERRILANHQAGNLELERVHQLGQRPYELLYRRNAPSLGRQVSGLPR